MYLPNQSATDLRVIALNKASELNLRHQMHVFTKPLHSRQHMIKIQILDWFEFRIFFLLDWLPYHG